MYSPVKISMSSRMCLYAIEFKYVEKELLAEIPKSSREHWDVFEGSSIEREPLVETPKSSRVYLERIEDGFVGKEPTTENPESSCWCWDVIICCSVDEETLTETSESTYDGWTVFEVSNSKDGVLLVGDGVCGIVEIVTLKCSYSGAHGFSKNVGASDRMDFFLTGVIGGLVTSFK